jgi:lysophospholipase L1-like esterase
VFLLYKARVIKAYQVWREKLLYYCWLLWFTELIILITGIAKVNNEFVGGNYQHNSYTKNKSYYHVWKAGSKHLLSGPEFSFERHSNSLGFADYEWIKKKPDNIIRILCLGDSFTEGDAAHYDSSYVAVLRRNMSLKHQQVEVLNAGTCGSDPFFNFANLRDRLIEYEPDIVIQTYSSNDLLNDYLLRGGMERFKKPNYLSYPHSPWWEPLYAVSYVFRVFVRAYGYNANLTWFNGTEEEKKDIIEVHESFFRKEYHPFTETQGMRFFLFALPMRNEIANNSYEFEQPQFQSMLRGYGINAFDLMPCYQEYLEKMRLSVSDVYWVKDAHHNAPGYHMMAACIEQIIGPALDSLITHQTNLEVQSVN